MKKFILILSVCAMLIGGSSCKKSYTCACTSNVGGVNSTATVQATNAIDASNQCDQQTQGGTSSCRLQ